MLKLIGTPAAHGRAVHVPGPRPIVSRDFIRLVYAAAGLGEPSVRVFGRGMYRLVGLFNPMARAAYEMAYLFEDPSFLMERCIDRSRESGLPRPRTKRVCRGPSSGSAATEQQLNTAAPSWHSSRGFLRLTDVILAGACRTPVGKYGRAFRNVEQSGSGASRSRKR